MTEFFCVRASDVSPLCASPGQVQSYIETNLGSSRTSRAGGTQIWEIPNTQRIEAYAHSSGARIERTEIPFPPRLRWGQKKGDQLIALTAVLGDLSAHTDVAQDVQTLTERLNMPVDIIEGHGGQVAPGSDDRLTIVIYGSPEPVEAVEAPDAWVHVPGGYSLFGRPMLQIQQHEVYLTNFCTRVRNTIYILLPMRNNYASQRMFSRLLRDIQPDLSVLSLEGRQAHSQAQVQRVRFPHLMATKKALETAQDTLNTYQERASSALAQLRQREQDALAIQARMLSMTSENQAKATYRQQLEQFAQMEQIADVMLTDDLELVVRTVPLEITNPQTQDRHLGGVYTIRFESPSSGISMPQLINHTRLVNGTHHPHCQPHPCWGNMEQMVPPLLSQGEYAAATAMVLCYLQTCNPDDTWGRSIRNWPRVEVQDAEQSV